MRININLASQPYEDAKVFYGQWLPLLLGLLALATFLTAKSVQNFRDSRSIDRQIAAEQAKIDDLDKEKKTASETLNQPENSGTHDKATFLNETFARKAFSWTAVLTDLEKMMPPQVQVTSIKPGLTPSGQLQVVLNVSTPIRENANELVRRMETSPHFQQAQIREEAHKLDTSSGDKDNRIKLVITALYRPDTEKTPERPAEKAGL